VGGSNNNALDNAASDANQNMSLSPAGSPVQSCGSTPAPDTTVSPDKKHWIAIDLVDEEGERVPYEDYRIILPDDTPIEGTLDEKGRAKINGIDSGTCKVSFPNRDTKDWKHI
jgi:type VI secretion system secreted protein VgrG